MYALKKFTGGLGDDDDRESGDKQVWKNYFTKPIEEAKFVVATRKVSFWQHISVRTRNVLHVWSMGTSIKEMSAALVESR